MTAEVSKLKADPTTSTLADLQSRSSNFWIAPQTSCMTYLIKDATLLNIVLTHRDDVDTRDLAPDECKKMVRDLFKDFEPRYAILSSFCCSQLLTHKNWQCSTHIRSFYIQNCQLPRLFRAAIAFLGS